jgi:hypothetical protein
MVFENAPSGPTGHRRTLRGPIEDFVTYDVIQLYVFRFFTSCSVISNLHRIYNVSFHFHLR